MQPTCFVKCDDGRTLRLRQLVHATCDDPSVLCTSSSPICSHPTPIFARKSLFSFSPICLSHAFFLVANPVLYSRASPGLPSPCRSHRSLGTQAGTLRAHVLWRN